MRTKTIGALPDYEMGPRREIRFKPTAPPLPMPGSVVRIKLSGEFSVRVRVEEVGGTGWVRGLMIGRWVGHAYRPYAMQVAK